MIQSSPNIVNQTPKAMSGYPLSIPVPIPKRQKRGDSDTLPICMHIHAQMKRRHGYPNYYTRMKAPELLNK
jgi:hypothetical protein